MNARPFNESFIAFLLATSADSKNSSFLQTIKEYSNRPFDDMEMVLNRMDNIDRESFLTEWNEQVELIAKHVKAIFEDPDTILSGLDTINNILLNFIQPIREALQNRVEQEKLQEYLAISKMTLAQFISKEEFAAMMEKLEMDWQDQLKNSHSFLSPHEKADEQLAIPRILHALVYHLLGKAAARIDAKNTRLLSFIDLLKDVFICEHQGPGVRFLRNIHEQVEKLANEFDIRQFIKLREMVGDLIDDKLYQWLGELDHIEYFDAKKLFLDKKADDPSYDKIRLPILLKLFEIIEQHTKLSLKEKQAEKNKLSKIIDKHASKSLKKQVSTVLNENARLDKKKSPRKHTLFSRSKSDDINKEPVKIKPSSKSADSTFIPPKLSRTMGGIGSDVGLTMFKRIPPEDRKLRHRSASADHLPIVHPQKLTRN